MKKTKKSAPSKSKKFILPGLILLIVALVILLVIAYFVPTLNNRARYERITGIYNSLKLDDVEYLIQRNEVFGAKHVYEYDAGRSYSSIREYVRGATVDVTVAELDKKIKDAGFEYFDEPYPGSVIIQYHYKSKKGEYIRLTVSSKPRDDALFNGFHMDKDLSAAIEANPNEGPSNVTIKVNLDDNNE